MVRRILVVLVLLACVAAAPTAGFGQSAPFSSRDLHALRRVGAVDITADGRRIAYVVYSSEKSGAPVGSLWIYDTTTATHTQVGDGREQPASLHWSPDGQWLACLGRADGRYGVVLIRVEGTTIGDPELLAPVSGTNDPIPGTGNTLAWSPGSSRLVYLSAVAGPEPDEHSGDPSVITRYAYKPAVSEGPSRYNDNRRLQLFMVDLVTRQPQALTNDAFHHHSVSWSPQGDDIYFVSNREPDPDRTFNDDLFAYSLAKRTVRRVSTTKSAEYDPAPSPDGKLLAFLATTRDRTSSETTLEDTHVYVSKADGTARKDLGSIINNRQGRPHWSADGLWLYTTVQERGNVRLYRLPLAGGAAEVVAPRADQDGAVADWAIARTGRIACTLATPSHPAELFVIEPGTHTATRVTHLNDAVLGARTVAQTERITALGEGGLTIEAFLTRPAQLPATGRVPMIVALHGGPHAQSGPQFNSRAQVYASQGWATLSVNYRGSTGYGQAFADAIVGDQNGAEARDVLAAVDAALTGRDWLDGSRLGLEGISYGGQLVNWLVTQTPRFAAAVSTAGIANLVSFHYTAYYHDYVPVEFGAYPHEGTLMDTLFARSPIRHVARVRTPVLLLHGELDNDVPITESEQFYIGLRDVGIDTILVRYPREGHGLRETRHQVDALDRSIAWYRRHFAKRP